MKEIINNNKSEQRIGICSVCSAHPLVIEAALSFDLSSSRKVLIEATSNQVNQFGGYTGMRPADFRDFVYRIADSLGFPHQRIILGGDHLGPNCWQDEPAAKAMNKAEVLIAEYVQAGFSKIHLDASMSCADDPLPLAPKEVALRAARLCKVAEETATNQQKQRLTYVIGSEVPVPGGEASAIAQVHVSRIEDVAYTLESHYQAFKQLKIEKAIERIIAVVVQPGVEFDHSQVIVYQPEEAQPLAKFIQTTSMVYEAHSTDYQPRQAYRQLVKDHFAILKVGPALTFALREAIFALAHIENALVAPEQRSRVLEVIDSVMLDNPSHWQKYYGKRFSQSMLDIHYSLSDRIRYYWPNERISSSITTLIANLQPLTLPLGLLSQYLPLQFTRLMEQKIQADPNSLIVDKIQDVLRAYAYGCGDAEYESL